MRRYYSKGGGADRMMSDAEKEFKAYNLMRDAMDREKFLQERKKQMEQDKKKLKEKKAIIDTDGKIKFKKGGRAGLNGGGICKRGINRDAIGKNS